MESYEFTRLILGIVFVAAIVIYFLNRTLLKKYTFSSIFVTRTAIFAAFSVILYLVPFLKFKLPFFPAFLEIHLDEVPILIAGFAYGPFSAIIITIVKTLVKLPFTSTLGVGELADLIYTLAFVIPASLIYKKNKSIKGSLVSVLFGSVCQIIVASFVTSFGILYFYMYVMGLSEQTIIAMCKAVNPAVNSLGFTFLLFVALPFNAIKNAIVIVLTFLLYKRLHTFIDSKLEKN